MTKIAFIIIHYKDNRQTLETLTSLGKTAKTSLNFSVFVVDNSPDNNEKYFSIFPNVIYLKPSQNLGFAEGNNYGIKEALKVENELIILLNSDTLVPANFLEKIENLISSTQFSIASPKIYFAAGFEYHKNYKKDDLGKVIWYAGGQIDWNNIYASHIGVDEVDTGQFDQVLDTGFATGCCMILKKEVFEKIGFFDPNYFLYYEDADLSVRAKKAGLKVIYSPSVFLWHKNAASSGNPGSPIHVYYQTRNRLYFASKYATFKTKILVYKESLKYLFSGSLSQKTAAKDFFLKKMGKGSL